MKHKMRRVLALLLAAGLVFSLAGCDLFAEDPMPPIPDPIEELPEGDAAAIAYYNKLISMLGDMEDYKLEVTYSISNGDVQADNETFKAALPEMNKLLTNGLKQEADDQPYGAAAYPLLRNDLLPADVAAIKTESVLELRLQEKLPDVLSDYEKGYLEDETIENSVREYANDENTKLNGLTPEEWTAEVMKDKDEALRVYTLQAKVSDRDTVRQRYQLSITLQPELTLSAAERYVQTEDKAAILAELAKAQDYLVLSDYEKAPLLPVADPEKPDEEPKQTYRITVTADNTTNHLLEIKLVARYEITTQAQGAGALADEGSFEVVVPVEKTVKITVDWPVEEEEETAA